MNYMKRIDNLIGSTPVAAVCNAAGQVVRSLTCDSREVAAGSCFFAVTGTAADGHRFIPQAVAAGAVAVVCQQLPETLAEGVCYVAVADTHAAMADMAAAFYDHPSRELHLVGVTGTNGKTTVSNLLTDLLEADGKKVLSNRSGSNITSGISTALLRGCDLLGRAKSYDMAVLEVDERASVRIFPYVKPDYAVVTNLTRDSIMRNAHPGYIADILTRSIPQTATMILNADDLITCGVAPENRRVYFGVDRLPGDTTRCENLIDDLRICPKCSGKLTYVYRRYHHIGKCVCPDCGFRSPESDYLATDVDMEKGTMALREGGEEHPYRLISDSVPNLYNMVTVIAVLRQLGYSHETISGYMSRAAVVATRHMEEQVGNVKLVRQMSKEKNALAGSRTFQYIAQRPGTKELLLMMNCLGDAHHWSENTCWIFDADFEYLRNDSVVQLVCTGARCRDYKLRLLMAGVPEERIVCEPDEFRAAELLHYTPGDDVYILYGTDSLALSYKVYDHMKEEAARHAQGGAEKEGQA